MKHANTFEKTVFVVVVILILIGVVLARVDHDFFKYHYVVEDGLIEWLTVFALVAAAAVCFRRAFILRRARSPLFVTMTALLGLACVFGAGEEISWGQRIFNIETPPWFEERNAQQEMNFHNLVVGDIKINKVVFGAGLAIVVLLYLFVLTPLYRYAPRFAGFMDALAVPIPRTRHVIAYVTVILLVYLLVDSSKRGELLEMGLTAIFLLTIAFPHNHANFLPDARRRGKMQ